MTRKIAMLCALLLMAGTLAGCKKTPDTTNLPAQQTTTTSQPVQQNVPYAPKPADGVLSCKRDGKSVAVTVSLPDCAGEEVSLIAISDPEYQLSWWENTDACLSDLGQIKLDDKGQGTLTLTLKSESDSVYLLLTASGCAYISEVK